MATRQTPIPGPSGRRVRNAVLISLAAFVSTLAVAGGGGHGGHGGHGGSGHSGHASIGHSGVGHSSHSGMSSSLAHSGAVHGGVSHGVPQHFETAPHVPHLGGTLGPYGHTWPGLDHRSSYSNLHRHAFWGSGFSYYSGPSYYRYRLNCDPFSFYYDSRYCYRSSTYSAPGNFVYPGTYVNPGYVDAYTSAALAQAETYDSEALSENVESQAAASGNLRDIRLPQAMQVRIPLVATPDAPDVLP